MAHVHGEKAVAGMMGSAMGETGKMAMESMTPAMREGMGKMMSAGTGPMMNMGQGMTEAMKRSMSNPGIAKGVAMGAVASAGGRSALSKIVRHPLILFGLGIAVGYLVHKYRKEIISSATRVGEKGKDFVLQQRENLEDIVARSRESGDEPK